MTRRTHNGFDLSSATLITGTLTRRQLVKVTSSILSVCFLAPLTALAVSEGGDSSRKINLAGRQRMLIQRAGKFASLAYLSPDSDPWIEALEKVLQFYRQAADGLVQGSLDLGLETETNVSVLRGLANARKAFEPYKSALDQIIQRREVDLLLLREIAQFNEPALEQMDAAVNHIERVYKAKTGSDQIAMLINIAGRQRMFTQRMILLLCLIRSDINPGETRSNLFRIINRFSISLNILQRVTPKAIDDSSEIMASLSAAEAEWASLKEFVSIIAFGRVKDEVEELFEANKKAENMLVRMNDIVLLYEQKG